MREPVAIVAALIRDARGRVLLVRKQGTSAFMQPGGKREAGEDDLIALARELDEEISCRMDTATAVRLGHFRAPAANEGSREVIADMYAVSVEGEARASAEIAEVLWLDPKDTGDVELAPLTRDHILPLVLDRGQAMTTTWPHLSGRLDGNRHVLPVRIYFEDTDFSGVVYHGSYVRFMERGRTDFLRMAGIGHDALARGEHGEPGGEGLAFTVRRMAIEFLKPARIDDVVEVETSVKELGGARIVLTQIVRRDADVLATAEVTVALINAAGQPRRLPDRVREGLAPGTSS